MFRITGFTLILLTAAGLIVIPFLFGLVKGLAARPVPLDSGGTRVFRPLRRVATLYGRFFVLYVIATILEDYKQAGRSPFVCANTIFETRGAGGGPARALPGATLKSNGTVQVCTTHPTGSQWLLYGGLIRLPSLIVWATVLLLIWQLIRQAGRSGPFSQQSAAIMLRLGLVILVGTAIAAAVSALGDRMLSDMLVATGSYGPGIPMGILLYQPLQALLPWPALAGAVLISFGRSTGAGTILDEEVRATV